MKKSDLPWILPLLTAFNEGKTIQFRHASGEWVDLACGIVPKFDGPGGAADYRIKPELKSPGHALTIGLGYTDATFTALSDKTKKVWNDAAVAVIRAYKNGELDLTGVNL